MADAHFAGRLMETTRLMEAVFRKTPDYPWWINRRDMGKTIANPWIEIRPKFRPAARAA